MALSSVSDYRILQSFIALIRFVLNPKNNDLKSFKHAITYVLHQQIRTFATFIHQEIVD